MPIPPSTVRFTYIQIDTERKQLQDNHAKNKNILTHPAVHVKSIP